MKTDAWKGVEELFHAVMERSPEERAEFLQRACPDDPRLRSEVQSLMDLARSADSFLAGSPISSLEQLSARKTGERVGNFELLELLGCGGMGEVWRACDLRLGRQVALKFISPEMTQDRAAAERFEREARAVAALNHPHIISIFDFGEEQGIRYMVGEVVEGESLRAPLRRGAVPIRKLLDIAVQIADGLAAAHAAGFVHRDLKPENIMITGDGHVKILDFGLARQTAVIDQFAAPAASAAGTQPGMILGTTNYMSPEQASGLTVDYRSDQFSFGLILYELASGRAAFVKESAIATRAAIVKEDPAPLDTKLPSPFRWIVDRCLAKDPPQRYESTRDLYHDLRALRDHLPETYTGSSAGVRAPIRGPAAAWKWIALALTFSIASAIAGALAWRSRQPLPLQLTFRKITLPRGFITSAQFAKDGKTIIYGAAWGQAQQQIFATRLENNESRPLDIPDADILSIPPSGEMAILLHPAYIGWEGGIGTLALAPLVGGATREILERATD
ncbi:MAG: serine/threonine protein kinase, partial [Acidobacteria bacterium]|nr:serine/threonine protein kinase [Acidobacteriota bacterium]